MMTHPLKSYRDAHRLTQGQLAEILGVSDATITHIENGRRRVTPDNAKKWEMLISVSKAVLCPEIFGDTTDGRPVPEKRKTDRRKAGRRASNHKVG